MAFCLIGMLLMCSAAPSPDSSHHVVDIRVAVLRYGMLLTAGGADGHSFGYECILRLYY